MVSCKGIGWWIASGAIAGLGIVLAFNVMYREPEAEPERKLSAAHGVEPEHMDCLGRDRWRCLEDEARRRCGVDNFRPLKSRVARLTDEPAYVCINEPSNAALR